MFVWMLHLGAGYSIIQNHRILFQSNSENGSLRVRLHAEPERGRACWTENQKILDHTMYVHPTASQYPVPSPANRAKTPLWRPTHRQNRTQPTDSFIFISKIGF